MKRRQQAFKWWRRYQQIKRRETLKKTKTNIELSLEELIAKVPRKEIRKDWRDKFVERQAVRALYGGVSGKISKTVYKEKKANSNEWIKQIECRADMFLTRLGYVSSPYEARQWINHGHVIVNGSVINVGSFLLIGGELLQFSEKMRERINSEKPVWNETLNIRASRPIKTNYLSKTSKGEKIKKKIITIKSKKVLLADIIKKLGSELFESLELNKIENEFEYGGYWLRDLYTDALLFIEPPAGQLIKAFNNNMVIKY